MTPPLIAFDPGALVRIEGHEALAEVTLQLDDDGWLVLAGETTDRVEFSVRLRAGFLDEFFAQARAREADAA